MRYKSFIVYDSSSETSTIRFLNYQPREFGQTAGKKIKKLNSKFLKNQIPPGEQNVLLFIHWKFHLLAIANCGVIQLPSALGTTCSAGGGV